MKTKLKYLFLPFSFIYSFVTLLRNYLFDVKILKIYEPPLFTINVGNLQIGGTGKTPHVSYLLTLFENEKPAVISRGYGRKTKGLILATNESTAESIGDEPLLLLKKHGIDLIVSENRVKAFKKLLEKPKNNLVILDDAYQHRYVKPNINILLTTYNEPFFKDFVLPTGLLREPKTGANRADVIIVTKTPNNVTELDKKHVIKEIRKISPKEIQIFFSKIVYKFPKSNYKVLFEHQMETVLLCGIAKPDYFISYGRENFNIVNYFIFSDHHGYSKSELVNLFEEFRDIQILTTLKDYVKIEPLVDETSRNRLFYLPIEIEMDEETTFNNFLEERFKIFTNHNN